jgi:RimJ/RimL family protein N-acetyltransferase
MSIKSNIKLLLNCLFEKYRINWIYASDLNRAVNSAQLPQAIKSFSKAHIDVLANSPTEKMCKAIGYNEDGFDGFVIEEDSRPVCVAHFADKARYDRTRTWPLSNDEMALIDIATEEVARGRGLAVRLIASATEMYLNQGKRRVIAFIWWSNTPSVRAFKKAGWHRIGFSVEALVMGKWLSFRIPI